jgi:hypothetical protein
MPSLSNPAREATRLSLWRVATRLPLLLYRLARWKALRGNWLPGHLWRHRPFDLRSLPAGLPVDVRVLVSDHFEPARRFGDKAAVASVQSWCAEYERLAGDFRDCDGRPPQHTWFYRFDYPNEGCLRALSECAFRGFGEVEFHLHHSHDSHASFARTLAERLEWAQGFGAMLGCSEHPQTRFGYVAGNSALDNGAGDDALSGCDTELAALREAGCYADFTFPNLGSRAQPRLTNTIYYACEDGRARSYDRGEPVRVGGTPSGDLMMVPGPVVFNWADGCVDDGAVENSSPANPRRLAPWLSANVHVVGRPEWVFVKLHTHAMQNRASFLGPAMRATLEAMQARWARPPFRLHYVTAREAYNIIKAAEAGLRGNPNDYRDFEVAPPANRLLSCTAPWRLLCHTPGRAHVRIQAHDCVRLTFAGRALRSLAGSIREVDITFSGGEPVAVRLEAEGAVRVEPAHYQHLFCSTSLVMSTPPFSSTATSSAAELRRR